MPHQHRIDFASSNLSESYWLLTSTAGAKSKKYVNEKEFRIGRRISGYKKNSLRYQHENIETQLNNRFVCV